MLKKLDGYYLTQSQLAELRGLVWATLDAVTIADAWASSGPESYTKDEEKVIGRAARIAHRAGKILG